MNPGPDLACETRYMARFTKASNAGSWLCAPSIAPEIRSRSVGSVQLAVDPVPRPAVNSGGISPATSTSISNIMAASNSKVHHNRL
eukprot:CAMPEP_0204383888 /NCGR_PEP_ID=MMETSP0469-20131031/56390_1 /ASSEMBLY_ACC=CAM_ASM_000384 /TAXON_ID=2969 /ORGANISM="Oxyrrhis marina" /LENGTH=85 /DNA_ID=CAMNT_0051376355 /DNA_START=139 /DNA_END=397 /DNA_ORIENTATION=-